MNASVNASVNALGWIKVCGLRSLRDLEAATEAGVDAVGLNLFAGSRRHVSLEQARELSAEAHRDHRGHSQRLEVVGVFVNASLMQVLEAQRSLQLDWVQLHGEEREAFSRALMDAGVRVMRALRLSAEDGLTRLGSLETVAADRLLVDAPSLPALDSVEAAANNPQRASLRGGSGRLAPWPFAKALCARRQAVLAGGLTPENVAQAIRTCRPFGVDVASGVEQAQPEGTRMPPCKDARQMRRFVEAARAAFDSMDADESVAG